MEDLYFYIGFDSKQKGPMTIDNMIAEGITKSTLVWKDGMKDWVEAESIPEFAARFSKPDDKTDVNATPPTYTSASNSSANSNAPQPGNNYSPTVLPLAILCTIFCCVPFGVVAIVYSAIAKSLWRQGKIEEGNHAHSIANKWIIWSIASWFIFILIFILMQTAIFALLSSFMPSAPVTTPPFSI